MLRMTADLKGVLFLLVGSMVSSVVHLIAARAPDRNAATRLMRKYYELPWPLAARRNGQDVMYGMFAGSVLMTLFAVAALIYELALG